MQTPFINSRSRGIAIPLARGTKRSDLERHRFSIAAASCAQVWQIYGPPFLRMLAPLVTRGTGLSRQHSTEGNMLITLSNRTPPRIPKRSFPHPSSELHSWTLVSKKQTCHRERKFSISIFSYLQVVVTLCAFRILLPRSTFCNYFIFI